LGEPKANSKECRCQNKISMDAHDITMESSSSGSTTQVSNLRLLPYQL
jgi:hypothetical protein